MLGNSVGVPDTSSVRISPLSFGSWLFREREEGVGVAWVCKHRRQFSTPIFHSEEKKMIAWGSERRGRKKWFFFSSSWWAKKRGGNFLFLPMEKVQMSCANLLAFFLGKGSCLQSECFAYFWSFFLEIFFFLMGKKWVIWHKIFFCQWISHFWKSCFVSI